jgi:putative transposase
MCPARQYDSAVNWGFARLIARWFACRMLLNVTYRLGRRLLRVLGTVARSDGTLMAEVLVLRQENAVLRRQVARVHYEPADRAWFAALSALIPRTRWVQVFPVAPATLLFWHRTLVNRQFACTRRPRGRPKTTASARAPIVRMARGNPRWGHRRIQGELTKLGFQIAHSTVWEILHKAGIDPAPPCSCLINSEVT